VAKLVAEEADILTGPRERLKHATMLLERLESGAQEKLATAESEVYADVRAQVTTNLASIRVEMEQARENIERTEEDTVHLESELATLQRQIEEKDATIHRLEKAKPEAAEMVAEEVQRSQEEDMAEATATVTRYKEDIEGLRKAEMTMVAEADAEKRALVVDRRNADRQLADQRGQWLEEVKYLAVALRRVDEAKSFAHTKFQEIADGLRLRSRTLGKEVKRLSGVLSRRSTAQSRLAEVDECIREAQTLESELSAELRTKLDVCEELELKKEACDAECRAVMKEVNSECADNDTMHHETRKWQHVTDTCDYEMRASQRTMARSACAVAELREEAKKPVEFSSDSQLDDLCLSLFGRAMNEDLRATVAEKLPTIVAALVTERINAAAPLFFNEELMGAHDELFGCESHRHWNLESRPMEAPPADVPPCQEDFPKNSEPIVKIPKSVPTPPMTMWNGRPTRPRDPPPRKEKGTFRNRKIAGREFADFEKISEAITPFSMDAQARNEIYRASAIAEVNSPHVLDREKTINLTAKDAASLFEAGSLFAEDPDGDQAEEPVGMKEYSTADGGHSGQGKGQESVASGRLRGVQVVKEFTRPQSDPDMGRKIEDLVTNVPSPVVSPLSSPRAGEQSTAGEHPVSPSTVLSNVSAGPTEAAQQENP
jgi:hypothetical protein